MDYKTIMMDEIAFVENLPTRIYNICIGDDIRTLFDLLEVYRTKGHFMHLRSCGEGANRVLVTLCQRYEHGVPLDVEGLLTEFHESTKEVVSSFSTTKKKVLTDYFLYLYGINGGIWYDNHSILDQERYLELFLYRRLSSLRFKDLPYRTSINLEAIKVGLDRYIDAIKDTPDDKVVRQYIRMLLEGYFTHQPEKVDGMLDDLFDRDGKVKLFSLLDLVLREGNALSDREKLIFTSIYIGNAYKIISRTALSQQLHISLPSLKGIVDKFEKRFKQILPFVGNINADYLADYKIDASAPCIVLDDLLVDRINSSEGVQFNLAFYTIMFSMLLGKTHYHITGCKYTDYIYNMVSGMKNTYFISKDAYGGFSYRKFCEDYISKKGRVEWNEGYMQDFFYYKVDEDCILKKIAQICRTIIHNELGAACAHSLAVI
jgi:hypothetical protein